MGKHKQRHEGLSLKRNWKSVVSLVVIGLTIAALPLMGTMASLTGSAKLSGSSITSGSVNLQFTDVNSNVLPASPIGATVTTPGASSQSTFYVTNLGSVGANATLAANNLTASGGNLAGTLLVTISNDAGITLASKVKVSALNTSLGFLNPAQRVKYTMLVEWPASATDFALYGSSLTFQASLTGTTKTWSRTAALASVFSTGKPTLTAATPTSVTVNDTFSTIAGVNINAKTYFATSGQAWKLLLGIVKINGRADIVSANGGYTRAVIDAGASTVSVSAKLGFGPAKNVGLIVGADASAAGDAQGLAVVVQANQVQLVKVGAGASVVLATQALSAPAPSSFTLTVERRNASIRAFLNGVAVLDTTIAADVNTAFSGRTGVGIEASDPGAWVDDLVAGPIS